MKLQELVDLNSPELSLSSLSREARSQYRAVHNWLGEYDKCDNSTPQTKKVHYLEEAIYHLDCVKNLNCVNADTIATKVKLALYEIKNTL